MNRFVWLVQEKKKNMTEAKEKSFGGDTDANLLAMGIIMCVDLISD